MYSTPLINRVIEGQFVRKVWDFMLGPHLMVQLTYLVKIYFLKVGSVMFIYFGSVFF